MVTCLRSPSSALFEVRIFSARCLGVYDSGLAKRLPGSVVSAAPQDRQNFFPGVRGVPQLGQAASSRAPQSSQKRASALFSAWQRGHFIRGLPIAVRPGRFERRREIRSLSAIWSTSLTWGGHFWKCDHSGPVPPICRSVTPSYAARASPSKAISKRLACLPNPVGATNVAGEQSALQNFLLSEPVASSILASERHARTRGVPSLPGLTGRGWRPPP